MAPWTLKVGPFQAGKYSTNFHQRRNASLTTGKPSAKTSMVSALPKQMATT